MNNVFQKIVIGSLCIGMLCGLLAPIPAGGADLVTGVTEDLKPLSPTTPLAPEQPITNAFPAAVASQKQVLNFEKQNPMNKTMVGLLLANLTSGELIAAKNSTMLTSPSEWNEWLFLLYVLKNADRKKEVTIQKKMLDDAKKAEMPVLFGFKEKDVILVEDLVKIFMMNRADDARTALIAATAGSESRAISKMNQLMKELGMTVSTVLATDGAYVEGQHTSAYDLYLVVNQLLTQELFFENYEKSSLRVNYTPASGKRKTVTVYNAEHGYSHLYGKPTVPEGYRFLARISGGCAASGLSQVILAGDVNGSVYLGILTGIPFEKDIALESERLLRVLSGEGYSDQEQILPLGDDTVRYDYLLGTDVTYFTVDNKAPGYSNNQEASRYMMEITVPVWILNEESGERTASTKKIEIHRKLAVSVKKIFQEIYALPCQFPIKTLLGYGFRKSGGVGLSNCTLMSIHSFGAAIDINPGDYDNDYYLGAGNDLRDRNNPYCIPDEVIEIFEKYGWYWGGDFSISVDSMHFQYLGLDFLTYQGKSPFMTLDLTGKVEVGSHVENLQLRLKQLGYFVNQNGIYTEQTRAAVIKFQTRQGLPATGVVDYKTWETVINLTHYMPYAF